MQDARFRRATARAVAITAAAALGLTLGRARAQDTTAPPSAPRSGPVDMRLTSPSFADGGRMPVSATCAGAGISPPLRVNGAPPATRSLALIVEDRDAPRGPFAHWVAWNAPPSTREIPQNAGAPAGPPALHGLEQGTNGFGHIGYGGACPPRGVHRYTFRAYALDTALQLPRGAQHADLERAMRGHVLAEASLTGTTAHAEMRLPR